jgi:DNA-binding CsgD family transcriptional regulator
MKNKIENTGISDLKNGFFYDTKTKIYTCLFCNTQYEDGDVYTFGSRLVYASKAIILHIAEKHGTVFENLLATDKAQTGLTDTQKDFLRNYYNGLSDKEIAEKMNISASTVRYQRYNFREKAKQARLICALYELLAEREEKADNSSKTVNDSNEKIEIFFTSVSPLILKTYNVKGKNKLFILETIMQQFEVGRKYTEKEVNAVLMPIYDDHVSIRRSLIDYGLMSRTSDGKEYWVNKK